MGDGEISHLSRRRLLSVLGAAASLQIVGSAMAAEDDDPLASLARPAIGLTPNAKATRRSHFGGSPLAPKGFEWPRYGDKPLDFLLEVDLLEAAGLNSGLDLPKTGRLLFFYLTTDQKWGFDPADRGCSRVYWFEPSADDARMAPPGGKPLPELAIDFSQKSIKPDPYSRQTEALGLSNDRIAALFEKHYEPAFGQLGGFPFLVQDDTMELESEATAAGVNVGRGFGDWINKIDRKAAQDNWQLLLQLPYSEELGFFWGDSGFVYFWIRREDLARRDFSRVWLILQSY